jgi:hypothetical protein
MALPTVTVTAGSGTTVNTLAPGGQAAAASSHPVVAASDHAVAAGSSAALPFGIQGVSGGVAVPVTGTFFQVTQPVSGTVTANIGTAGTLALDATLTGGTQQSKITDGTNVASVKAASTAAVATDKAVVVAVSPNNTIASTQSGTWTVGISASQSIGLATGSNVVGAVTQSGTWNIGTITTLPALTTGSNVIGAVTQSGTWNIGTITTIPALPTGANTIGAVNLNSGTATVGGVVVKPTATAGGQTLSRVTAAASTNATNLKASAGNIIRIAVFNTAAYTVFLKLYNKASAPTVGTDTPTRTIPIPASTGFAEEYTYGRPDATGISYAITKLQADSDTTAVVAGDLIGEISWI